MKFLITIEGEANNPAELRMLREISALLNSSASSVAINAAAPAPTPVPSNTGNLEDDDDTGTPGAPVAEGTLDTQNFPWDGRIHASTKNVNADGTWRKKKGLDAGLLATVEAELRGKGYGVVPAAAPQPSPAPAPQPMPTPEPTPQPMPTPQPSPAPAPMPTPQPEPAPQPMPTPAPAPQPMPTPQPEPVAAAPAAAAPTLLTVMQAITTGMGAGKISTEYLALVCQRYGITGVQDLAARPDLVPTFYAQLQVDNKL